MGNFPSKKLCLTAAACALIQWGQAITQDVPDPQRTDRRNEDNPLQDIIVTARRVSENLQKVPVAVTAISPEKIAEQNIVSPQSLAAIVPSLSVNGDSSASFYTIRGQGGQTQSIGDPSVVAYLDEIAIVSQAPGDLFDLANIQVLKGPQGTLFGRNTTGGAILFQTKRPTNDLSGYLEGTTSNYGLLRFQGAVNLPVLDDKLLVRFATDINHRRGYTQNILNGQNLDGRNYQAYRFSMLAKPFDGLENYTTLQFYRGRQSSSGTNIIGINTPLLLAAFGPDLGQGIIDAYNRQQARGIRQVEHDQPGLREYRSWAFNNTTTFDVANGLTLTNLFGYRNSRARSSQDTDGTAFPLINNLNNGRWSAGGTSEASVESYSDEIKAAGDLFNDRLHYTAGLFFESRKPAAKDQTDQLTVLSIIQTVIRSRKDDKTKAAYGQVTFDVTPELHVTAGARRTQDKRHINLDSFQMFSPVPPSPDAPCPNGPGDQCNFDQSTEFNETTWNFGVDYQITPDLLLYGVARRGYKSGGFNIFSRFNPTFKPEFVNDIELGFKSQFPLLDGSARINIAAYRSRFKDWQTTIVLLTGADLRNAGAGTIQGVEAEGTFAPTDNFELSGYYAYTDAHYTDFAIDFDDLGAGNNGPMAPIQFADTNHISYVPKHKLAATAKYKIDLPGNGGQASFSATYTYQSHVFLGEPIIPDLAAGKALPNPNPDAGQKGYGVLNLRADWRNAFGGPFDLAVFATNVTKKTYLISQNDLYTSFGFVGGQYGEPRMVGITARYHFGGE